MTLGDVPEFHVKNTFVDVVESYDFDAASLGSRSAPGKLVPECHASSVETKNSCSAAVQIQRCFRGYQGRRAARHAQKLRNILGMLNDIKATMDSFRDGMKEITIDTRDLSNVVASFGVQDILCTSSKALPRKAEGESGGQVQGDRWG